MVSQVREVFHGELDELGAELTILSGLVGVAMERATRALLEKDLSLAEQVITDDARIDQHSAWCERHACALLALQAPVAKDLRVVVTAIRAAERLERMGDLARHVAKIARLRHPHLTVPAELGERFARMGQLALLMSRRVEHIIAAPGGVHVLEQQRADDEIDQLQRDILDIITQADPPYPVRVGIDAALLARYFERFADQAVSITRQLDYVVTGSLPGRADR
jgi:phosphate transport system protein